MVSSPEGDMAELVFWAVAALGAIATLLLVADWQDETSAVVRRRRAAAVEEDCNKD